MLTQRAVDVCGFGPKDKILDVGCGNGTSLQYLWEAHRINGLGTDFAPQPTPGQTLRFIRSKLPALPFKSRVFTGIFCECVLSLIMDKETCLAEFFRLLKTNGKLVITDLYIPQLFEQDISHPKDKIRPHSCIDGALTLLDLIGLVESAGFKVDIIEDHTKLLKQLAGQMVFEHGSLNNFWDKVTGSICDNSLSQACRTGTLRPGYCMLIAGKYE